MYMHKYTKIIDKSNFRTIDSLKNTIKDHKKHNKVNNVHFENNDKISLLYYLPVSEMLWNLSYTLNSSVNVKVWFIYMYRWLFLQNFTDINLYLVVGDPVSEKDLDSFASGYSCCLGNNKLAIVPIAST